MNLEKEIYKLISERAKLCNDDGKVKDMSRPTLWRMSKGRGETSMQKALDFLFANGVNFISISTPESTLTANKETGEVNVTTKSLSL